MAKDDSPLWEGYPALFEASDRAAGRFRRSTLATHVLQLGLLALAGLIGALVGVVGSAAVPWLYAAVAVSLFLSLVLTLLLRAMQYETLWFDCRAIAESTKTTCWRFMMGAPPFTLAAEDKTALLQAFRTIRGARREGAAHLAETIDDKTPELTPAMVSVRRLPVEERRDLYAKERLSDQHSWYVRRAKRHAQAAGRWFAVVLACQIGAVTGAIAAAACGTLPVNVAAILTTLAAAVIAWDSRLRNAELARSYTIAAEELGALKLVVAAAETQETLASAVEETEEEISREHTLWCARRNVQPPQATTQHRKE
jgi:hypothetical protein